MNLLFVCWLFVAPLLLPVIRCCSVPSPHPDGHGASGGFAPQTPGVPPSAPTSPGPRPLGWTWRWAKIGQKKMMKMLDPPELVQNPNMSNFGNSSQLILETWPNPQAFGAVHLRADASEFLAGFANPLL